MARTAPLAPAREPVTCAHPGCRNTFTPKTETHRFCSARCKQRSHAYRFALGNARRA